MWPDEGNGGRKTKLLQPPVCNSPPSISVGAARAVSLPLRLLRAYQDHVPEVQSFKKQLRLQWGDQQDSSCFLVLVCQDPNSQPIHIINSNSQPIHIINSRQYFLHRRVSLLCYQICINCNIFSSTFTNLSAINFRHT